MSKLSNSLIVLFASLIFLLVSGNTQAQNNLSTDMILWNQNRMIRWSDFKKQCPPYGEDSYINAFTYYKIDIKTIENEDETRYEVYNYFIKSESWFRDSTAEYATRLLKHEICHFNIAEIYTRKIRLLLISCKDCEYKDVVHRIEMLKKELLAFQEKYDKQTCLGILYNEQLLWEKLIREELSRTDGLKK